MPKSREEARRRALASLAAISDEEDAAITAAAKADPDNPPVSDEDFAAARRYRPRAKAAKQSISLRLEPDVLDAWKATGDGWQTRMGDTLRKAVGK